MALATFAREVLGDGVPSKVAEVCGLSRDYFIAYERRDRLKNNLSSFFLPTANLLGLRRYKQGSNVPWYLVWSRCVDPWNTRREDKMYVGLMVFWSTYKKHSCRVTCCCSSFPWSLLAFFLLGSYLQHLFYGWDVCLQGSNGKDYLCMWWREHSSCSNWMLFSGKIIVTPQHFELVCMETAAIHKRCRLLLACFAVLVHEKAQCEVN